MTDALLGIVVVNYGSHALLEEHLAHLDAAAIPARVVVVDNFSSRAELASVTTLAAEQGWDVIASPTNLGFGAACNLGAARAAELGCDTYLFLNPDAFLTSGAAAELAALSRQQPRSLISPVIRKPDGSVWFRGSRLDLRSGRVGAVHGAFESGPDAWLTGACLVAHSEIWSELGGFADDYFLYWEDVDLSRRVVDLGGSLIVAADISATHDVGGTQEESAAASGRAKSAVYYYYNCRNRLLFGTSHLGTRELLGWLARTPRENWAILLRGGRKQFLQSPGLLWAGVRGTAVGVGLVARELFQRMLSRGGPGRAVSEVVNQVKSDA